MSGDTITLTDPRSGEELVLRRSQQSDLERNANADVNSPPGSTPDNVFISVQGTTEDRSFIGLVTAPMLSDDPDFSDDWRTALAQYAQRLEAFAYSRQFTGYTLDDGNRDDTGVNVILSDLEWELESGAINQLSYELTFKVGEGVLPDDPLSIGNATPGGGWVLDGNSLDRFEHISVERSVGLDVNPRAYASGPGENDIKSGTSAPRKITFRGVKTGPKAVRNSFDDTMRSLVKNKTVTFETDFPGYSLEGVVLEYNPSREAATGTDMHTYDFVFQEGRRA